MPSPVSSQERQFWGRNRGRHGLTIDNSPNRDFANSEDTGPLIEILFLEEGRRGICGSAVAGGERFCMSCMDECNTASHTCSRVVIDELPGGKGGGWVVLALSTLRLPEFAFYQPALIGATDSKVNNFEVLPLSSY